VLATQCSVLIILYRDGWHVRARTPPTISYFALLAHAEAQSFTATAATQWKVCSQPLGTFSLICKYKPVSTTMCCCRSQPAPRRQHLLTGPSPRWAFGAMHPKDFCALPPNFIVPRKICFKHVNTTKTLPPKGVFSPPPNLETWLRACLLNLVTDLE